MLAASIPPPCAGADVPDKTAGGPFGMVFKGRGIADGCTSCVGAGIHLCRETYRERLVFILLLFGMPWFLLLSSLFLLVCVNVIF